ncbi:MAG: SPOCS domain-containing protein [Acutalibacteraceae bacterium]
MKTKIETEAIKTGEKKITASAEQSIEMEINLPDYCADVKKILKCSLDAGVSSVSLSGERANMKGTATLRVVYLSEKDTVDVCEKTAEINISAQIKNTPEGGVILGKAKTDYVNCRAVSPRRITVNASVGGVFTYRYLYEDSFCVPPEDKEIQVKTEKLSGEECLGFYTKTFDMGETFLLNEEHPTIGKIICSDASAKVDSIKLSSGKLLIKGEVCILVFYKTENGENSFHHVKHTMPINQIVDVRDLPDEAICEVRLKIGELLMNVKADSSSAQRLIEFSLRVNAFIKATEKKQWQVIRDCYCTSHETVCNYEKPEFLLSVREIKENKQLKQTATLPERAKEILFVKNCEESLNISFSDEKATFNLNTLYGIYYLNENSVFSYCEKNIDHSFSYAALTECENPQADFSLTPLWVAFNLKGEDLAEISCEYLLEGKIQSSCDKNILKDLEIKLDSPKAKDDAALTVYFTDEGESLWDIARLHNTTVELICEENSLTDEKIEKGKMLLIPCV